MCPVFGPALRKVVREAVRCVAEHRGRVIGDAASRIREARGGFGGDVGPFTKTRLESMPQTLFVEAPSGSVDATALAAAAEGDKKDVGGAHQRRTREIPRAQLRTSSPPCHAASPTPTSPPLVRPLRTYKPSPLGLFRKSLPCFLICVRCAHPQHALCCLCMNSLLWEETERDENDGWLKREYRACDSCDRVFYSNSTTNRS